MTPPEKLGWRSAREGRACDPILSQPGPDLYQCLHPRPKGWGTSMYSCPACRASEREHSGQVRGFFIAIGIAFVLWAAGVWWSP